MMYVTAYNMSFNSNCRILAADLNYRFTKIYYHAYICLFIFYNIINFVELPTVLFKKIIKLHFKN